MSQILVTGEAKIRDIQGPVVANSGVITALDGAASQYVRGDGTLADFPTSTGGGSSVSYYLNSSVSQGTIGGVAYRELSKEPIIGAGTDIAISANGYVANYLTDVNDPDVLSIPGGNFNCEFYFSVNNNTGSPTTYAELYKYDGTTFTLLGTSAGVPESINQGTTIAPYYFAIPVATASLSVTDRLAIRIYVNVDNRTVTLHTENGHLCQVVTTFSKGMVSLNNLTDQSQYLATGTSGTNFAIVSSGDTHTFNLPVASATNTGKLSNTDWSTFNGKVPYTGAIANVDLGNFNFDANNISGAAIIAKLNGPASSPFVLKSGSSGYTIGDDAISLISSPNVANTLILASNIGVVTKTAQFGLGSLTATRTFTLPDITGTLALLEGTQTFSGVKTFTQSPISEGGYSFKILASGTLFGNGYSVISSLAGNVSISQAISAGNLKSFTFDFSSWATNTFYTYALPASDGTIALTSDISYPVTSVFGRTGAVVAQSGDYTTTQVTEGTNLYYTDARSRGALSFTAGSGAYNSTTGVITIPTNNNQITNGAGYITSSALSGYLPLTGGTLTGGLNGTTATFSGLGTFYQLTMTGATAGRIFYAQTGGVVSQSGNLNWNNTTEMLGVGTPNPTAVITAFSNNAATQFKASGNAPAFTFSESLTTSTRACVFGLATAANQFITGTAAGDMAIANQSTTAGAIVFGTGTAEKMRMSPSGNFGLGTSNPSSYTNLNTITINGTSGSVIDFKTGEVLYGELYSLANEMRVDAVGASGVLKLLTNSVPRLTIASTGAATFSSSVSANDFVFSGTNAVLQNIVSAGTSPIYGYFQNTGGVFYFGRDNSSGTEFGAGAYSSVLWNTGNNAIVFATNNTQKMTITSGGNVGIGTSSPRFVATNRTTLDINGTSTSLLALSVGGADKSYLFQNGDNFFLNNVVGNIAITTEAASNITFATANTERMRIAADGNILMHSTSFNSSLVGQLFGLTGDTYFTRSANPVLWLNRLSNDGVILTFQKDNSIVGTISTNSNSLPSDLNFKKNISTLDLGLNLVTKLRAVSYNHKIDDDDAALSTGFIAQELEQSLTELGVKENQYYILQHKPNEDAKQSQYWLDYTKMIPVLVKAIQEQQGQIEELKALIAAK